MPRVTGRIASGRRTSKSAAAVTEFRVVTVSIAGVATPQQPRLVHSNHSYIRDLAEQMNFTWIVTQIEFQSDYYYYPITYFEVYFLINLV